MTTLTFSSHCLNERMDRLTFIAMEIGWGEVILEAWSKGRRECLTDTGVLLVKAREEEFIITAYVPSIDKACALYKSCGLSFPASMAKTLKKNHKIEAKKFK